LESHAQWGRGGYEHIIAAATGGCVELKSLPGNPIDRSWSAGPQLSYDSCPLSEPGVPGWALARRFQQLLVLLPEQIGGTQKNIGVYVKNKEKITLLNIS